MAWAPDYVTAAELKSWLRITDTADDTLLAFAITTASRAVDAHCGRQFGQITPAAARYYTFEGYEVDGRAALLVDDIYSLTGLAVAVDTDADGDWDTTITYGTDFDVWPANAAADGRPWTRLLLRPSTSTWFTYAHDSVRVTALYGWAAVPSAVKLATLLLAAERFARRNAPFGIAGSPEMGTELRLLKQLDPDAWTDLQPLRQLWAAA